MSSFVDSKHQKLSQEEIIAIAAKETGGKYSTEQVKASVAMEVHSGSGLVIREGNTLFIIHKAPTNPTVIVFRALNADIISNYLKNSVIFTKAMGLAGFKYMVTQFEDKALLNIFKYVKRHAPFKDMGYAIQQTVDNQYRVTVNLGDAQKGGLPDRSQPSVKGNL